MNVLFCVRHNFYTAVGGAYVQIMQTMEKLRALDVNCDIVLDPRNVKFHDYDIIHLTDLTFTYDLQAYLKEIDAQNFQGSLVLSTIYWPFDDYAENGAPFFQRMLFRIFGISGVHRAKSLAKLIMQRNTIYLNGVFSNYLEIQKNIISRVDLLLPNSHLEMQALSGRLGLETYNYFVAYNAIDVPYFESIKKRSKVKKNPSLITFVARIDPRKNQIGFLQAMMETHHTIRFVGGVGVNAKAYYSELKRLALERGNVEFIPHSTQDEVFAHMLESKVNVLTSWIETPGLVSLEAAYAGCNIVVSDKGSVREYFRDYAYYCDPSDNDSVREAVLKAVDADFDEGFIDLIKMSFSWERTADATLAAYFEIVNSKNGGKKLSKTNIV